MDASLWINCVFVIVLMIDERKPEAISQPFRIYEKYAYRSKTKLDSLEQLDIDTQTGRYI